MDIERASQQEPEQLDLGKMRLALEKRWSGALVDMLANIILKARRATDQPLPVGVDKLLMIGAWAEVLADLELEEIDEYYQRASRVRTNGYAVNALDIVAEKNRSEALEYTQAKLSDQEQRKLLGWKRVAAGTKGLPTPGTLCEYPDCTLLCLSRYCIVHGEQIGPYFHSTLKPEYRPKLVEAEDGEAH